MPTTKLEVASSALVMIGANAVSAFSATGTAEEIACHHLYQTCLDQWLSLFPWRFATKTAELSRDVTGPVTLWSASYQQPADMKALQAVIVDTIGRAIPFDRFEDKIRCDAGSSQKVYAVYTYEPAVVRWPGYFVALMEVALANKLAFALASKLDLKADYEKDVEKFFRLAKNADSRQQTTRRLPTDGYGTILEARRS